jgi:NhaP-type Na+/H+ or K+/H+ antiporter
METAIRLVLGASLGAAGGVILSRARSCGSQACNVRANLIYSVIAGAVFGAAAAWYVMNR